MQTPDLIDQQAALFNALRDGQDLEQALDTASQAEQPPSGADTDTPED